MSTRRDVIMSCLGNIGRPAFRQLPAASFQVPSVSANPATSWSVGTLATWGHRHQPA